MRVRFPSPAQQIAIETTGRAPRSIDEEHWVPLGWLLELKAVLDLARDVTRHASRTGGFTSCGHGAAASHAFEAAYVGSDDPLLRADIVLQIGQIELWQRGPVHARDRLVAEAALVEPHDVDRAALLLAHAANTSMMSSDIVGGLVIARRASSLAAVGAAGNDVAASLVEAYLSLQHGDVAEFEKRFGQLTEVADALLDTDLPDVDMFLAVVGILHVYTERWEAGRVYLAAVAHRAKRRAHSTTAAQAVAILAELCWRSGRWAEAWKLANSDIVDEVTLTGARLWLVAFGAHLDAAFGRGDECRRKAEEALVVGEPMGFGTVAMWANSALGLLELGFGHSVAAATHLDRVDASATAHGMTNPSCIWWQADHIEALVRSGRRHEALQALARFESGAATMNEKWPVATAARCRALLADPDDAERWFEIAVAHHGRLTAPFELARTLQVKIDPGASSVQLNLSGCGGVLDAVVGNGGLAGAIAETVPEADFPIDGGTDHVTGEILVVTLTATVPKQ